MNMLHDGLLRYDAGRLGVIAEDIRDLATSTTVSDPVR